MLVVVVTMVSSFYLVRALAESSELFELGTAQMQVMCFMVFLGVLQGSVLLVWVRAVVRHVPVKVGRPEVPTILVRVLDAFRRRNRLVLLVSRLVFLVVLPILEPMLPRVFLSVVAFRVRVVALLVRVCLFLVRLVEFAVRLLVLLVSRLVLLVSLFRLLARLLAVVATLRVLLVDLVALPDSMIRLLTAVSSLLARVRRFLQIFGARASLSISVREIRARLALTVISVVATVRSDAVTILMVNVRVFAWVVRRFMLSFILMVRRCVRLVLAAVRRRVVYRVGARIIVLMYVRRQISVARVLVSLVSAVVRVSRVVRLVSLPVTLPSALAIPVVLVVASLDACRAVCSVRNSESVRAGGNVMAGLAGLLTMLCSCSIVRVSRLESLWVSGSVAGPSSLRSLLHRSSRLLSNRVVFRLKDPVLLQVDLVLLVVLRRFPVSPLAFPVVLSRFLVSPLVLLVSRWELGINRPPIRADSIDAFRFSRCRLSSRLFVFRVRVIVDPLSRISLLVSLVSFPMSEVSRLASKFSRGDRLDRIGTIRTRRFGILSGLLDISTRMSRRKLLTGGQRIRPYRSRAWFRLAAPCMVPGVLSSASFPGNAVITAFMNGVKIGRPLIA